MHPLGMWLVHYQQRSACPVPFPPGPRGHAHAHSRDDVWQELRAAARQRAAAALAARAAALGHAVHSAGGGAAGRARAAEVRWLGGAARRHWKPYLRPVPANAPLNAQASSCFVRVLGCVGDRPYLLAAHPQNRWAAAE